MRELEREQDQLLDRISAELSRGDARREPSGPLDVHPADARVVIAEDEAIIRLDLAELLEEEGYDVVGETGRGDEAVELVRELRPDLVILDIKMPGLDGLGRRDRWPANGSRRSSCSPRSPSASWWSRHATRVRSPTW